MAEINLKSVSIEFPVYNLNARSVKKQFLRFATGGSVVRDIKSQHVLVKALQDINLKFEHGDRIGLIGHNGSGKSTLLRLLASIYEPTQGEIHIDGRVSSMLDLSSGMENESTGYENILIRGTILGLSRDEIKLKMQEIAEFTGLGDYLEMPMRMYSTGMMVRLAFAISTSINPDVLLVDEIFGAGDAAFMEKARNKMISLLDKSNIVVIATHSDDILRDFCNKGLLLEAGKVKYFGDVTEALRQYHEHIG